jgi:hypothetical protein
LDRGSAKRAARFSHNKEKKESFVEHDVDGSFVHALLELHGLCRYVLIN